MSNYSQLCGIDVSKDTLDYCVSNWDVSTFDKVPVLKIPNEVSAILEDFSQTCFDDTLFVVESTGTYSSKVLRQLSDLNRPVFLVNSFKSKSFMSAQGVTNKSDHQAARSLAQMGRSLEVRLYQPLSDQMQKRKQVLSTLRALEKQERTLGNQIHALEQYPIIDSEALDALNSTLAIVRSQIQRLKSTLNPLQSNEVFKRKMKYGTSVKGIADKTAETLLILTNNLETFEHPGQVSKFLGIVNWSHDSGTSVRRKGGITKFGNAYARSLLYMCTRSAIRYNLACK